MRQIVLDTETTGLSPERGHRIIEIGCIELLDRRITGEKFHTYINPQREIDEAAFRTHGISREFLEDKPLFKDVMHSFIQFVDGAELIIHNAPFDVGFINTELNHNQWPSLIDAHCSIFDTLVFAKERHPGLRNNLDALCKRYEIDNSMRSLHGALLDANILALIYLAMTGGQTTFFDELESTSHSSISVPVSSVPLTSTTPVLMANEEELSRHNDFIQYLIEQSGVNHWDK